VIVGSGEIPEEDVMPAVLPFSREALRDVLRFNVRTIIILAVVAAMRLLLFGADKETIVIRDGSTSKDIVLVSGSLQGKPVQLECFLSVAHCKVPEQGEYVLIRFPEGKGPYMDCPNLSLDRSRIDRNQKRSVSIAS
jgi:hypothetical protein